ncbi:MAG: hypothetical protein AB9897_01175 [Anaerolineaceae bacterium]
MPKQPNHQYNQTSLNLGFAMSSELAEVTDDLVTAIIRVMMFHVGRENVISRLALVEEVRAQGVKADERVIRLAVSELRRQKGMPIAGTGGIHGGYWILKDEKEKNDYVKVQLHDPGVNLLEQASAIEKSFNRWYPGGQLSINQIQQ